MYVSISDPATARAGTAEIEAAIARANSRSFEAAGSCLGGGLAVGEGVWEAAAAGGGLADPGLLVPHPASTMRSAPAKGSAAAPPFMIMPALTAPVRRKMAGFLLLR